MNRNSLLLSLKVFFILKMIGGALISWISVYFMLSKIPETGFFLYNQNLN